MKRIFIIFSILISVFFFTNALASNYNDPLIKLYDDLFKTLSKELTIENKELKYFSSRMKKYINQDKIEFGMSTPKFIANIAIANASLIVGYSRGIGESVISASSINFVMNNHENLYRPTYTHDLPFNMPNKDPKFIFKNNILPIYTKSVSYDQVTEDYLELLDISSLPAQDQILVLKATTGIASGVAEAQGDTLLKKSHIEIAKTGVCEMWPKCQIMLANGLSDFSEHYQVKIKEIFWGK